MSLDRRALIALALAAFTPAWAQDSITVSVRIVDGQGAFLPARVHVEDARHHRFPPGPDSLLLSHSELGGYFYTPGTFDMRIPRGTTKIEVGRGFEWSPVRYSLYLQQDQALEIELEHPFDLRALGWFGGDTHIHTQHLPLDYTIDPPLMHQIALAEDLPQAWCLDGHYQFSGGPHPVSTPEATIYYSMEYRNQATGHVALLGLKEYIGLNCCAPPNPVYPLLCGKRIGWSPEADEGMVLAHPWNGGGFFEEDEWPGMGLGRELPVMAALGHLDALDIVSYVNTPNVYLDDWYRLLDCGLRVPPSAGTDHCVAAYPKRPPGGFRVYVHEGGGTTHDVAAWTAGLKAGRSFVTNYPLIPEFTVNDAPAGSVLELPGPTASVTVAFRVASTIPIQSVSLVCNGGIADVIPAPAGSAPVVVDSTLQVELTESSWLALRVDGTTDLHHPASERLFAHTGAVYAHLDGEPVRRTAAAAHFLDWLDSLQQFVDQRDNWDSQEQYDSVHQTIDDARAFYRGIFRVPPGPFALLEPAPAETVDAVPSIRFDWSDALETEAGDRVIYVLTVATDSLFATGRPMPPIGESELDAYIPVIPDQVYWWRVTATDMGGNVTPSTPTQSWFRTSAGMSTAGPAAAPADTEARLRVWPNPSFGPTWLLLVPAGTAEGGLDVLGADGRSAGVPVPAGDGLYLWSGRDPGGRSLPSGIYWARARRAGARPLVAPLILVR